MSGISSGCAGTSTIHQLRPQFRRQGSNLGGAAGHVTSTAVMVVPNKVDYSITKGGVKVWAVLLVFIALCSSIYTLFSAKEINEIALGLDRGTKIDYHANTDNDVNNNVDIDNLSNYNTPMLDKEQTLSLQYESHSAFNKDDNGSSIDDDHEDEEEEEEALFSILKTKAKEKEQKKFNAMDNNIEISDQEMNNSRSFKKGKPKKEMRRRKYIESFEKNELNIDGISKTDQSSILEEGKINDENQKIIEQIGDEVSNESMANNGVKDENEFNKIEKIINDENTENEKVKRRKKMRRSPSLSITILNEIKCKRKKCSPENDPKPRMSLLKQIPLSMVKRRKRLIANSRLSGDDEDDDDEDDDDEIKKDDDEIDNAQKHKLVDQQRDNHDNEINDDDDDDNDDDKDYFDAVRRKKLNIDHTIYNRQAITNKDDHRYIEKLDQADYLVEKHDYDAAISIYEEILRHNADSPRAIFGIARANDIRSEFEQNNALIDMAISKYQEVLDISDTPDALFRQAAQRLIDRARFRGSLHRVLQAQRSLIDRYPEDLQLQNDFGLTFLMMRRNDDATKVFENVLSIQPSNGIAQAYYGYIMKLNGNLELGTLFMRKGLRSAGDLIVDPRFYFHFGDALMRLGKKQEAHRVYTFGAKLGLYLSPYQRSLYNVQGLTTRSWWTLEQTGCSKYLKEVAKQWTAIREEALHILTNQPQNFVNESDFLISNGHWSAYQLYKSNVWNVENCLKVPNTWGIMKKFKESSRCLKSEIKFSLLKSGTRVWSHCGYTNCRLQVHLGLVTPSEARIRVGNEVRGWRSGRFIIFDDSFEHEIWFDGAPANKYRLTLEFDLWHPEVDDVRRIEFDVF